MKAITKKEFESECYEVIKELNNEELQSVSKGLQIMYFKLKDKELLQMWHLNVLSEFIMNITFKAEEERLRRLKDNSNEVPY